MSAVHYNQFEKTHQDIETYNPADMFSSAIGRIVLNYAELEAALSFAIIKLLKLELSSGRLVTSQLTFSSKIQLISSLLERTIDDVKKAGKENATDGNWPELAERCLQAKTLRDQVLRSQWSDPNRNHVAIRHKINDQDQTLIVDSETMSASDLMDVADYIVCVAMWVEDFADYFITPEVQTEKRVEPKNLFPESAQTCPFGTPTGEQQS